MESGLVTGKVTEERIRNLSDTDWRKHKPDHPVSALLHPPRKEPFLKLVAKLGEIAAGSDHTVGQLAVAWTLRLPEVTSAIVGARRLGQITETVKAGSWTLSDEELAAIEAAHTEFLAATA